MEANIDKTVQIISAGGRSWITNDSQGVPTPPVTSFPESLFDGEGVFRGIFLNVCSEQLNMKITRLVYAITWQS